MLIMIDNYDSFTYNIVQYLAELGAEVEVHRNDEISIKEIKQKAPSHLVISPGPCNPDKAGISLTAIDAFTGKLPILGICLGHQSIGQAFGGKIVRANKIMHGKTSSVYHNGSSVFAGLPDSYTATRYHSLVIEKSSLPSCLELTAWTQDESGEVDEIMGVRHKDYEVHGVQFHPESILTDHGHALLKNFITI